MKRRLAERNAFQPVETTLTPDSPFPALVAYDKPTGDSGGPQIDLQKMLQEDAATTGSGAPPDGGMPKTPEQQEQQNDDALMKSLRESTK